MKKNFFFIGLLILLFLSLSSIAQKKAVIAYYAGSIEKLDSFDARNFTHIIYCFGHLQGDQLKLRGAKDTAIIQKMVSMKYQNKDLKVLLSLGGWGGCEPCSDVFSTAEGRINFAKSVKSLTDYFGADGIDLDWEYPAIAGFPNHKFTPEDKPNFTELVKALRKELGKKMTITFAAGGFQKFANDAVDWSDIMPYVNYVNLMTYDLVSGYEKDLTGKATLAAEDIRFARTIDRIQRILLSELYKIALVHLYSQGYDGEQLTNFELKLTTPSIIAEQEKVALLKEKVALAKDMLDTKIIPSDWIYDNVFQFSQDQYDEYRDLIIQDQKRAFRNTQIAEEGNDPIETGRSYGTPHDLASLYGRERYADNSLPDGYDEKAELGRPKEKASNIDTQDNPLGRDRLGKKDMKKDDQESTGRTQFKGGSPLALEGTKLELSKNRTLLEGLHKKLVFQSDKAKESLLDESNLTD